MYIIRTKDLSFRYRRHTVLNGLDLLVPRNSIYGYLGKNGAGKSTTIKLLLGLLDLSDGSIVLEGHDGLRIGSMVEQPCYYEELSGFDNLKYIDFVFKRGKEHINHILQEVGLTQHRNKKVKHYSTGMKQRLGMAMAIYNDPEILILDEPMNGLDPQGMYDMRGLMLSLHKEGKTIFISSHILSEVEKICTHVGILDSGKLLYQGGTEDLRQKYPMGLEAAFLQITSDNNEV